MPLHRVCQALLSGLLALGLLGMRPGWAAAGAAVRAVPAIGATVEVAAWQRQFKEQGVTGTLVLVDERQSPPLRQVFNTERASLRFSPASTFKIPHTLFALDAGVVADEFEVFSWDGVTRAYAGHNRDQTLRSAMRHSSLWVFQGLAQRIGTAAARTYLQKLDYGNADPSTRDGDYWVDGALRISALEQVEFLRRLYRNALPFQVVHQRLVKDLLIQQASPDRILRAKTGWEGRYGWWVGWVESPEGAVFFALNIDTPRRMDDLPKREQIGRAVLRSVGALDAP